MGVWGANDATGALKRARNASDALNMISDSEQLKGYEDAARNIAVVLWLLASLLLEREYLGMGKVKVVDDSPQHHHLDPPPIAFSSNDVLVV